jgi:hypothetical protein
MTFDSRPFAAHYRAENQAELEAIRTRASVARKKDFNIDLALNGGDVYKALDVTEGSPFDVDLVRLDRIPVHLRARIEARGIVLAGQV